MQTSLNARCRLVPLSCIYGGLTVHCLYGGFGNSKLINHDYYRPRVHKTRMAICLNCWKLIQVNDEKPKKLKTGDGSAIIIQNAWRRFKERDLSNARLAWLSLPNDNTLDDKKFLGLTPCKVKNPISLDQIKMRFNKEYAKYIKKYNRLPYITESEISTYQEYIILYNWIGRKKNQLRNRFQKRLSEIEA
ncbi:hypothetical protein C2G38_2211451 [Gigaspora rosea]|uniref:Uncharacterized protein n=1 Tax=Gigaspora rosea TaxID=44941 RepID=A0A397UN31_9GLOM|nr:hypothetical protein C2G38_2211451 [Gigaspora rosea]